MLSLLNVNKLKCKWPQVASGYCMGYFSSECFGRHLIFFSLGDYFPNAIWLWPVVKMSLLSLMCSDSCQKEAAPKCAGWQGKPACDVKLAEGASHGYNQELTICML